ncbi:alpha-L-fucosidase [Streptomyces sp. NBC_01537]|uniref:alpha-L-fucosidase n=1 Tax=Streptomyces sp. NBC_01537 TaxID=2903896 RepID=UPI00387068F1
MASLDTHPVPQWHKDAKFGVFIHWGVYSVPAGGVRKSAAEWYLRRINQVGSAEYNLHRTIYGPDFPYDAFIPQFKAENYNPDEWVRLFESAGARYFVVTSKHHDGFAVYPSVVTNRHSVAMGLHRDLVGELVSAARRRGTVRPGLYYSLGEFYNPALARPMRNPYTGAVIPYAGYLPVDDYVRDYELKQLREIIDRYDPDLLWGDGPSLGPSDGIWHSEEVLAYYYNQAKNRSRPKEVAVNDRFGMHYDFATHEQRTNSSLDPRKWECCITIGASWGYNKAELAEDFKTSEYLVHLLVDVVSKNGNLLLNVGPRADGTIPDVALDRLRAIGAWLDMNGEGIYGSSPWSRPEEAGAIPGIRHTLTPGKFHTIMLGWPRNGLAIPADVPISENSQVKLHGNRGEPLSWSRRDGKILITLPDTPPGDHAYTFTFDGIR